MPTAPESNLTAYGAPYMLNGVEVIVGNSNPPALPAQMPEGSENLTWPTSIMAAGSRVMMTSGAQWRVNRPPVRQFDGGIQVSMTKAGSSLAVVIFVGAADLDTPIWYTGVPIPVPDPNPEPPTVAPGPPASPVMPEIPTQG